MLKGSCRGSKAGKGIVSLDLSELTSELARECGEFGGVRGSPMREEFSRFCCTLGASAMKLEFGELVEAFAMLLKPD